MKEALGGVVRLLAKDWGRKLPEGLFGESLRDDSVPISLAAEDGTGLQRSFFTLGGAADTVRMIPPFFRRALFVADGDSCAFAKLTCGTLVSLSGLPVNTAAKPEKKTCLILRTLRKKLSQGMALFLSVVGRFPNGHSLITTTLKSDVMICSFASFAITDSHKSIIQV